ncbi:cytochrome P450 [Candidatus Poriferisodalis sp.]|uniref:cytochrome P450 n=1 Tax=Candidatus Poriferisodalis sp. TaxID=3101277 RepID=UPI003B013007
MDIPTYDGNYFSKKSLLSTNAVNRQLRDLGPLVYLSKQEVFAVARYDDVREALRADETLVNGHGISVNNFLNTRPSYTVLVSDGEVHKRRRAVLMESLGRPQINELRDRVEQAADDLVIDLLNRDGFCAVKDFASHLPVKVVTDLVGLPPEGREQMLDWAAATFQMIGPMNARAAKSIPRIQGMQKYIQTVAYAHMTPGGWAARTQDAVSEGRISADEGRAMLIDFIAPSLDTTILAAAHMFWELARNPEAYEALRADPDLVPSAVNEAVRMSSPIRGFTRSAETGWNIEGSILPVDARLFVLWSSANHDERHYEDPETFTVERNPRDHLGWGFGSHFCAGAHLARLEMEQLLYALCRHAQRLELKGPPIPIVNNILQGFATMPARLN